MLLTHAHHKNTIKIAEDFFRSSAKMVFQMFVSFAIPKTHLKRPAHNWIAPKSGKHESKADKLDVMSEGMFFQFHDTYNSKLHLKCMVVSPRRLFNLMRQFHHELNSDSFRHSCAAIDKGESGHAKVNDKSVVVGSNNIFQLT